MKEFIKEIELTEIEKVLRKDFFEWINEVEKLKNNIGKLKEEFIKRKEKIMELVSDPRSLKIKIYKDELDYKLDISKELVCLFCIDNDLLVGINENKNIKIIVGKLIKRNDIVSDIVILINIGIFFFHLNVWLSFYLNKNEKIILLNHFYYMYCLEQKIGYSKV